MLSTDQLVIESDYIDSFGKRTSIVSLLRNGVENSTAKIVDGVVKSHLIGSKVEKGTFFNQAKILLSNTIPSQLKGVGFLKNIL